MHRPNEKRKNQRYRLNFTKRFVVYLQQNGYSAYFPAVKITTRDDKNSVYDEFRRVLLAAGIPHYGRGKGPRVHDFRHTFACHCLHRWIRNGVPISSALPRLSTYLGHNDMAATEKYLHMTAEVYPEISEKLSREYGYLIPKEAQS